MPALEHEIPVVDLGLLTEPPGDIPVDVDDPRHREPLVELSTTGIAYESYFARSDGGNAPFHRRIADSSREIWLRRSVVDKLLRVNRFLRPFGVELFVITGYTAPDCLRGLWAFHLERARRAHPQADERTWRDHAKRYVRDPDLFDPHDARTWPAHTTGGAVDVLLRERESGDMLDMGSHFEEILPISNADYFERQLAAGRIASDDERLHSRRLLHHAMSREGFVNEPPLYWHFDWGNQLYVKTLRALSTDPPPRAWYGFAGLCPFEGRASDAPGAASDGVLAPLR